MKLDEVRAAFPALASDWTFLENAGGSQVPAVMADRMRDYLRTSYVQLGAGYPQSVVATDTVDRAHDMTHTLMGAGDAGKVILGSSSSALCYHLAQAVLPTLRPGDELVLAETAHEANFGPWARLEAHGATIKPWRFDPVSMSCPMDALADLLSERTRYVAFPQVSNLLGDLVDVTEVTRRAHAVGAQVVVDGVAYAPHRAMDVAAWGVDWYVFSIYKVYGPHMAALYGTHAALAGVEGPNHYFVDKDDIPYKFELGGVSHEGCAGWLGTGEYLSALGGRPDEGALSREAVVAAFARMQESELPAQSILLDFLIGRDDIRVIGPQTSGPERVATISFVHDRLKPSEITRALHERKIAMRHGHMYALRMCRALGLDDEEGVVRISLVHYNTVEEARRTVEALSEILS